MKRSQLTTPPAHRGVIFIWGVYLAFLLILLRLAYWQIIKGQHLEAAAERQYQKRITTRGSRGIIYTQDNHVLVGNQTVFRVFFEPKLQDQDNAAIVSQLVPHLIKELPSYQTASSSAQLAELETQLTQQLTDRLQSTALWISLFPQITQTTRDTIANLQIKGLGFEPFEVRFYPEASLAAQVTGFVGKNAEGEPTGYFGLEGALHKELEGRSEDRVIQADALGLKLFQHLNSTHGFDGRDIYLTLRRDLQWATETALKKGLERYRAKAGEIIIIEPKTGKILALATLPHYDQATFYKYDPTLYKNPAVSASYEPGSIFKIITVAAGIDQGLINPETTCPVCDGPRIIAGYTIKTWNDQYHPNTTINEALANSDNTAMIYITDLLGPDRFKQYVRDFQISQSTTPDLQEDTNTPFPPKWGPTEVATISFGQGISTTSLQMIRAIAAIANNGVMVQPQIIEKVRDRATGREHIVQVQELGQVVSRETAQTVTEMMINAADHGEAKWTISDDYVVAGKTGTSQVAVDGAYDPDKTIASFVGFSPPEQPRFLMFVKLVEPQTSPWASETAAPLWYDLAKQVHLLLEIPPDRK